jgi:hypothetical protein
MLTDELFRYIFNGQPHRLAEPMETWLASSRRFSSFVDNFKDKIRKKVYTTQDHENLLDLQLELETAYLLLKEKSLNLEYEPIKSKKTRGPDFAVTFTTSLTFMVEVTRLQAYKKNISEDGQGPSSTASRADERLADAICSKLGQLLPQRSNVLLIGVEASIPTQNDLRRTMLHIEQRVQKNDELFLRRYQFRDRSEFFQHYQRLSEILIRESSLQGIKSTTIWVNPQAKHSLPSRVRTALYRSHTL